MSRLALFALLVVTSLASAQETKGQPFTRTQDVIYGRKHGVVLTMDVFKPAEKGNGLGVVWCVSGGWFSSHGGINPKIAESFTRRGYTVFQVVHGSQPRFTIPEILDDMHRAVRFIRFNANQYGVDPDRIGISGSSAGGHLSLMQGMSGVPGNPKAPDPIDRTTSRVQAVACFYPPTDFLNYGKPGEDALGRGILANFKAPFMFTEFDPKTKTFALVTDEAKFLEIGKKIAPFNHVTKDDPPTLIIHGDADKLVPIQQAEIIINRLKEVGVPAELVVKKGAGHGWLNLIDDIQVFADWFDRHLAKK